MGAVKISGIQGIRTSSMGSRVGSQVLYSLRYSPSFREEFFSETQGIKRAGAVKLRPYLPRMSKLGNLILGLLLRSRNNAQLLHHAQLVHVVPTFHHFALLGEPEDAYPRNHHLIASGSDASELALVGAASLPTGNDLVPFGYLILDNAMKIGEGLTELAHESLDVLGATFQGSAVGLVGDVPVEDLVR